MRRLFVLFLILLLPLQVFAAAVEDRLPFFGDTQQSESGLAPAFMVDTSTDQWNIVQSDNVAPIDLGQNNAPSDEPTEDFASHAAFGDEAVPASFLIFALHIPDFISALHNDAASIPPYLPPAARPPKI